MAPPAFLAPASPVALRPSAPFTGSAPRHVRAARLTRAVPTARLHLNMPTYPPGAAPAPRSTSAAPAPAPTPTPARTLICTSLTSTTLAELRADAAEAARLGTDLVELRLDYLSESELPDWHTVLPHLAVPAVVTNRPVWEGGRSTQDETARLSVLVDATAHGVAHVDVELKAMPAFQELLHADGAPTLPFARTKLIVSFHDFDAPLEPDALADVLARMRAAGADICKVAMKADRARDAVTVLDALAAADGPTVCLAMGELGQVTRVAAGRYGAYMTFATLDADAPAAPGQVDLATMRELYGSHRMTGTTKLFGIVGDPVSKSMSPAIHNAALRARGLDGAYVRLLAREGEFADYIRDLSTRGFAGMSVTMPAKLEVLPAMDELDGVTEQIGAMNTVVQRADGSLKGYNTDWVAAISAVEEQFADGLNDRVVVCIGAGGAGRALAFGALARGASKVIVVNRSRGRADELAGELGEKATAMSLDEFSAADGLTYDALLNSTSVGMKPDVERTPVPKERIVPGSVVFDAVYNPMRTRLLAEAEECGCITVSGLEMFLRQGVEQFRLWFPDTEPPVELMREVLLEKLGHVPS